MLVVTIAIDKWLAKKKNKVPDIQILLIAEYDLQVYVLYLLIVYKL